MEQSLAHFCGIIPPTNCRVLTNPLISRWWFQTFCIFMPIWGQLPILTTIFQMGRNHQPDLVGMGSN